MSAGTLPAGARYIDMHSRVEFQTRICNPPCSRDEDYRNIKFKHMFQENFGFRLRVKSRKQSSGSVLKSHRFSSNLSSISVKVIEGLS